MKQPLIDAAYLRKNALFFEPQNETEAAKLQQRLIALGYVWRNDMNTVSFVSRCVADGITALPEGRMMLGQPAGIATVNARYEDFFALDEDSEASLHLLVRNLERSVRMMGQQVDDNTRRLEPVSKLAAEFSQLSARQKAIEDAQFDIKKKLDELIDLLRPRDLSIKKQRQP